MRKFLLLLVMILALTAGYGCTQKSEDQGEKTEDGKAMMHEGVEVGNGMMEEGHEMMKEGMEEGKEMEAGH